ncbi:MAG: TetR family transcriptional regulator [Alphaproteobacteria bacterium]
MMARKTKEAAQETRQQILAAAEEIFFRHGVSQTSLDEIATTAGVTRGAIYWHFKNKLDLFKALFESVRMPQEEIIERAVAEGHPDALGMLETTIREAFSILVTDHRRQRVFTILNCRCEYVGEMQEFLDHQRDANQRMQDRITRAFYLAREQGALSPAWKPDDCAGIFINFVIGIFTDWIRFGQQFDLVEIGSRQATKLIATFKADAASPPHTPP